MILWQETGFLQYQASLIKEDELSSVSLRSVSDDACRWELSGPEGVYEFSIPNKSDTPGFLFAHAARAKEAASMHVHSVINKGHQELQELLSVWTT